MREPFAIFTKRQDGGLDVIGDLMIGISLLLAVVALVCFALIGIFLGIDNYMRRNRGSVNGSIVVERDPLPPANDPVGSWPYVMVPRGFFANKPAGGTAKNRTRTRTTRTTKTTKTKTNQRR